MCKFLKKVMATFRIIQKMFFLIDWCFRKCYLKRQVGPKLYTRLPHTNILNYFKKNLYNWIRIIAVILFSFNKILILTVRFIEKHILQTFDASHICHYMFARMARTQFLSLLYLIIGLRNGSGNIYFIIYIFVHWYIWLLLLW